MGNHSISRTGQLKVVKREERRDAFLTKCRENCRRDMMVNVMAVGQVWFYVAQKTIDLFLRLPGIYSFNGLFEAFNKIVETAGEHMKEFLFCYLSLHSFQG